MNIPHGPRTAEPDPETPASEARISTGNENLDSILHGGLVAHRPYLIVGPCGTGKTKLALQFLCEGIRRGERVLLVTLEDPPNEMRINHRGMEPELDRVFVFDAIPDVMRYERAPFKDIAAVRSSVPFSEVDLDIRKTAELISVEVTFSALEQTLKMEMARRNYSRLVVDSLTALQYFCMKGIDETQGAQSFLRFLSDLRVTALLTVEAPVEEVESAERLLARGEVRLFRWELEGRTVRAIGVEKFRGSAHDNRLHPYRISPTGLDIDVRTTISRDTRRVVPSPDAAARVEAQENSTRRAELDQIVSDLRDLASLGIEVAPAEAELGAARAATTAGKPDEAGLHIIRARAIISELAQHWDPRRSPSLEAAQTGASDRVVRIATEAGDLRAGGPPPRRLETWSARSEPDSEEPMALRPTGPSPPEPATARSSREPGAAGPAPPSPVDGPEAPERSGEEPTPSVDSTGGSTPEVSRSVSDTPPASSVPLEAVEAVLGPSPLAPSTPNVPDGPRSREIEDRAGASPSGAALEPTGPRGLSHPPLPLPTPPEPTGIELERLGPDSGPTPPPPALPKDETRASRPSVQFVRPARSRPPLPQVIRATRFSPEEPASHPVSTEPHSRDVGKSGLPLAPTEPPRGSEPEPGAGPLPPDRTPLRAAESEPPELGAAPEPPRTLRRRAEPTSEPVLVSREVITPPPPKRTRGTRRPRRTAAVGEAPAKPRRRTANRRNAPPVTRAAPGTPPPDLVEPPPPSAAPSETSGESGPPTDPPASSEPKRDPPPPATTDPKEGP